MLSEPLLARQAKTNVKEPLEVRLFKALAKVRVEPILDSVVSSAIDLLGDIAPTITVLQVKLDDEQVLL